ncbi:MAG: ribose-phosphate diphosphokinase [bacterium]
MMVFAGNSNPQLAESIAEHLKIRLGHAVVGRFSDGEVMVEINEHVRGKDVFVVQSTCAPSNDNLMELLILIDAARRASANRITAVLPFYGYARQDRKDQPRVPITAKLVANLIVTAGADRILTMDLHAGQIQGFFDIPVDHLYARPVFGRYLEGVLDNKTVVVGPDVGSVKMAQAYSDMVGCGFAVVAKRRLDATNVVSSHLVGEVDGLDCVLVDDLTTSAGTLVAAAAKLKQNGARRIFATVSHCCMNEDGNQRIADSAIDELITTDSLPSEFARNNNKIRILSVAELLGEAMCRIHEGLSVSSLFRLREHGTENPGADG